MTSRAYLLALCFAGKPMWKNYPSFIQVDYYKLNGSRDFLPNGNHNKQFCVIRIYGIRFEAEKGLWVPYPQGQLTTDPSSDSLKTTVSKYSLNAQTPNVSWNPST